MSHTAWPTLSDISGVASLMNVTLNSAASQEMQQNVIDSVIESIKRNTHRTFIPVTEDRTFDGNGKGMIEVNEYISINTITIVGWYGNSAGLTLADPVSVNRPTYPRTYIQIYAGSVPAFYRVWIDQFPVGRSNIKITGIWGYDTTIPSDLWWGAAYQSAGILINLAAYKVEGFLIKWEEAGVTEVRGFIDPFKYFQVGKSFKSLCNQYKLPSTYQVRKQAKVLV